MKKTDNSAGALRENHEQNQGIKVITKAVQILDLFSIEQPKLTLNQICDMLGYKKTTVFRILCVLCEAELLEKDTITKQYHLGLGILKYSALVLHQMELRRRGVQFTEHLAKEFGITAGIAIQKENEVVIVDMKNFNAEQAPSSNMGFRDPIYCTAIGKILLAINAQENEVLRIIGSDFPLKKYTVNTIIHKEALLQELNDCRKKGYAIDNEESLEGLRCVAVPIFDNTNKAIAALYVSSMWNYSIETLTGKVLESCQLAAASLSKEMGCLSYFANIEAIKNREC